MRKMMEEAGWTSVCARGLTSGARPLNTLRAGSENLGQGETVFEGTATRFPREIKELCTEGV